MGGHSRRVKTRFESPLLEIKGILRGQQKQRRTKRPGGFWKDKQENRRQFFEWLGGKLGYQSMDDWYNVAKEDIRKHGGRGLLHDYYRDSPSKALQSVYPEHNWMPWRFKQTPNGFWEKRENQRQFFEWLGNELGYQPMDDWYNVTVEDIQKHGGVGLLNNYYSGSPSKALQSVYPEHNWMLWKFRQSPKGFQEKLFHDPEEKSKLVDWLSEKLAIRELDDWYRISLNQIAHFYAIGDVKALTSLLVEVYPKHQWNMERLKREAGPIKSAQRNLYRVVQELLPTEDIKEDFKHPNLFHGSSNVNMQLDVFISRLQLAFEFQGEQHYRPVYSMGGDLRIQAIRDEEKRIACQTEGITLIEVPYWWDFQKESLAATIHQKRPDIILSLAYSSLPIPVEEPKRMSEDDTSEIPCLSLGEYWDECKDLTGWWITEKMDGVRTYWDGQSLWTRQGKQVKAPKEFVRGLPDDKLLDGELWMGRGTFEQLLSALNSNEQCQEWNNIRFYVFDLPSEKKPHKERMETLKQMTFGSQVCVVPHFICRGNVHLMEALDHTLELGGEGLVANNPESSYEPGRTKSVLKIKHYQDTEVKVLSVLPTGLLCIQQNGLEVIVNQRGVNDIAPGSVITVKHTGSHYNGQLRRPVFWRKRKDFQWKEISSLSQQNFLDKNEKRFQDSLWTKKENHRTFFDQLGKELGFSKPEDWYALQREDVREHGGERLLKNFLGGYVSKALRQVYPEHKWQYWGFQENVPRNFWDQRENQRQFFEWLGNELGYQPMDDWYNVTVEDIQKHGGVRLLRYYIGSPSKALQSVYPEHNWMPWRFKQTPNGFWEKRENQRQFFEWLGNELGYQSMDDWYNVTQEDIQKHGGVGLLHDYYNDSPSKALQAVYPECNWMPWRFGHTPNGFWEKRENQRQFFEWLGCALNVEELANNMLHVQLSEQSRTSKSTLLSALRREQILSGVIQRMRILVINRSEVTELLPMQSCIEYMKEALQYYSKGEVVQPLRMPMWVDKDRKNLLGLMPGAISNPQKLCGVKVISIFPGAHDSHQGAILLFEAEHGAMVSMINASEVTAIRTAACSGVATELLMADKNDIECAILGSGAQARTHLLAMVTVCKDKLKKVRVWSRNFENASKFVQETSQSFPNIEFKAVGTAKEAVEGADIINTVSFSPTPILEGEWVKPGAHINAVGACTPTKRELDSACVRKSKLFVDAKSSTVVEAGDYLLPLKEGVITENHIQGELGDILLGKVKGRTSPQDITLFKSLGIAAEDLVASSYIFNKAKELGKGTWLDL